MSLTLKHSIYWRITDVNVPPSLMISGLLWLLVVLEGQESESESLARLTEITTSLVPSDGFSWDESSSSAETNRAVFEAETRGGAKDQGYR